MSMAASIQQRVFFKGPGLVRLVSDQALLVLLSDSLLECEPWVPRCLAETIHRMWLFRGQNGSGFDHSDQFHEAWQQCGIREELDSALTKWCAQQQSKRSFDPPELSGGDDRLRQTWELLTRLLQHWKDSDGMVVFARESDDEAIRSAIVLPFVFGSRDDDGGICGLFGGVEGLDLMDALKRATGIASSKEWIHNSWSPAVRFPSLDAPIDSTPLVGMSASLPFLAALRARSKGRRFQTLRFGFSGVLDPNGRLEATNAPSLWAAKRALLTQLGAQCILPGDWLVNEPVQDVLNDLMAQVWDECLLAERIPVPPRAEPKKHDFQSHLEEKTSGFVGRVSVIDKLKASDRNTLVVAPQGTGKSRLMAELVQNRMGKEVIAHHFCRADFEETRNAMTFVQSLSAMLAERLPEYDDLLADEQVMKALSGTDAVGALSQGIIAPLLRIKPPAGSEGRYVIVDALDENGDNPISDLLARQSQEMPQWLKIIATTRDDPRVIKHNLKTWQRIDLNDDTNRADVKSYIAERLRRDKLARLVGKSRASHEWLSAELGKKCDGSFLYAKLMLQALEDGRYELDQLDQLPPVLEDYYEDTFKRIFPDGYSDDMRGILEVMLCARRPLRRKEIEASTGIKSAALRNKLGEIQSLLAPAWLEPNGVTRFNHWSLARWLNADLDREQREAMAPEKYQVSGTEGHKRLADWCGRKAVNFDGLSDYQRQHGVAHFMAAEDWLAVHGRLLELRHIECRVRKGEISDLLREYDEAVGKMPACERQIKAFQEFVVAEVAHFEKCGSHEGFIIQQAFNHQPGGPVHDAAAKLLPKLKQEGTRLLIRRWAESERAQGATEKGSLIHRKTESTYPYALNNLRTHLVSLCDSKNSHFNLQIWDLQNGSSSPKVVKVETKKPIHTKPVELWLSDNADQVFLKVPHIEDSSWYDLRGRGDLSRSLRSHHQRDGSSMFRRQRLSKLLNMCEPCLRKFDQRNMGAIYRVDVSTGHATPVIPFHRVRGEREALYHDPCDTVIGYLSSPDRIVVLTPEGEWFEKGDALPKGLVEYRHLEKRGFQSRAGGGPKYEDRTYVQTVRCQIYDSDGRQLRSITSPPIAFRHYEWAFKSVQTCGICTSGKVIRMDTFLWNIEEGSDPREALNEYALNEYDEVLFGQEGQVFRRNQEHPNRIEIINAAKPSAGWRHVTLETERTEAIVSLKEVASFSNSQEAIVTCAYESGVIGVWSLADGMCLGEIDGAQSQGGWAPLLPNNKALVFDGRVHFRIVEYMDASANPERRSSLAPKWTADGAAVEFGFWEGGKSGKYTVGRAVAEQPGGVTHLQIELVDEYGDPHQPCLALTERRLLGEQNYFPCVVSMWSPVKKSERRWTYEMLWHLELPEFCGESYKTTNHPGKVALVPRPYERTEQSEGNVKFYVVDPDTGSWRLFIDDTAEPTSFVLSTHELEKIEETDSEEPIRIPAEVWTLEGKGKSLSSYFGSPGLHYLMADGTPEVEHGSFSLDGRWLVRRERDSCHQISICDLKGRGALYKLALPTTSGYCLHRDNSLLAVHAPAGEIVFFELRPLPDSGHGLEVTACLLKDWPEDAGSFDQVYPPCCQKPFDIPDELAGRLMSCEANFDDEGLQIKCPNCAAKLLFNPYFISVQRGRIEVVQFALGSTLS